MAYVGQSPDAHFSSSATKDTFSGDGSTTAFTLTEGASTNTVDVFVENVRQEPTEAYSVDGTTLTFTEAPGTGTNNIYVVNKSPVRLQATHPAHLALEAHSATISTDLTVDTDTLHVDSTNNKVGIGTTSPSYHVDLNAGTDNFVLNGESTDSGAYIRIKDNNATGHYFGAKDGNFDIYNTSNVHRFRIDSNGHLILKKNLVLESTSEGIDFSGVGSSAQTLDDYEEGTWTPTIATGTVNFGSARYTRIGNLVHVTCTATTFSNRTSTSNVIIGGLPFSCVSDAFAVSSTLARYINTSTGGDAVLMYQAPSSTTLIPHTTKQNSNYDSVSHSELSSNSTYFYISHTYRT
jgi:hypothetical protein